MYRLQVNTSRHIIIIQSPWVQAQNLTAWYSAACSAACFIINFLHATPATQRFRGKAMKDARWKGKANFRDWGWNIKSYSINYGPTFLSRILKVKKKEFFLLVGYQKQFHKVAWQLKKMLNFQLTEYEIRRHLPKKNKIPKLKLTQLFCQFQILLPPNKIWALMEQILLTYIRAHN